MKCYLISPTTYKTHKNILCPPQTTPENFKMLNKWVVYVIYALEWICIGTGNLSSVWLADLVVLGLDGAMDAKFRKYSSGSFPWVHFNVFVV
jgi:hypothetical protein